MCADEPDDVVLVTALCQHFDGLRTEAQHFRWWPKLDRAVETVRTGVPVAEAFRRHGLAGLLPGLANDDQAERTGFVVDPLDALVDFGGTGPDHKVSGMYGCPLRRCALRTQADPVTGQEPICRVADAVMSVQPPESG